MIILYWTILCRSGTPMIEHNRHIDLAMKHPSAIDVVDRFAPLRAKLMALLSDLSEDDWSRATAAPRWSVKDVAAHLLGGDIGILARGRDGFRAGGPIRDYSELVELVNRLNDEWVLAARRMSPRLLRELLDFTGPRVEAHFASLDQRAVGGPVNWAGPEPAPVWFDVAREFTERWHHQQQIRDAAGHPPLYDPHFLSPVLDTFVRALPHRFRHTAAPAGTVVKVEISGEAGGVWFLQKVIPPYAGGAWELSLKADAGPAAAVALPQDAAWRMFTKGIDGEQARALAAIEGDAALASPVFATIAIIG
jgi:uncharacterized protein (TIGR03083 family)